MLPPSSLTVSDDGVSFRCDVSMSVLQDDATARMPMAVMLIRLIICCVLGLLCLILTM